MKGLSRFLILILAPVLLVFFQNCAKSPALDAGADPAAAASSGSLKVTSNVQLSETGSGSGPSQGLKANRYVNPLAIHFGAIAHDFSYQFPYSLNLASGEITSLAAGSHVDQLTPNEADELDQILAEAIVASRRDFMSSDTLCAANLVEGYASLVTDQGSVILGHGTSSCDIADLVRDDGNGSDAGLKAFLANLAGRL